MLLQHEIAMSKSSTSRAGVRDWVDSNFYQPALEPEKAFERTRVFTRDASDLLDGCSVKEIDINLDTIPGELVEMLSSR